MLLDLSGHERKTQVLFYNTLFERNVKGGLKVKRNKRCDVSRKKHRHKAHSQKA